MGSGDRGGLTGAELEAQIHYRLVERLSESERRYRGLVEALQEVVFQCDAGGRLVYVNPAWSRTLGHPAEACIGRPLADFVVPPDRTLVGGCLLAESLTGAREMRAEVRLLHADGRVVVADASVRPEGDGWIGSLHDETTRHQAQLALERAKRSAERADRLKGEFLANVSHEIRTPMSAVLGFATCLMDSDLDAEERRSYLERLQANGQHLLVLVNDILDLAEISAGQLRVSPEPTSLTGLLDELEAHYGPLLRSRAIDWVLRREPQLPARIVTDPHRMRQLLTILLNNAMKFTRTGHVSLSVSERGGAVIIAVEDTGAGIPAEDLGALFEPFHQVDGSATRERGGAGMGLAIARGIAAALGGSLQAESQVGQGSRFTLTLPLLATVPEESRPESASLASDIRVLLAEDTPDVAALMQRVLAKLGATVTLAANGAEARDRAMEAHRVGVPYDLILMDMQMPVLDGYRATAELRGLGYPGRIAAVTAHSLAGDRERCLAAGCDDYLAKPVDRTALRDLVARHAARERGAVRRWTGGSET